MSGVVLVTGGDGHLGRRVAQRLLSETEDHLVLAVRAADAVELAAKEQSLHRSLGLRGPGSERVAVRTEVVPVDLRAAEPFARLDPARITAIVHSAARTAFTVRREEARQVNVEGTRRVSAFARRCPRLQRFLLLSTLYSAGRRTGTIEEAPHPSAAGFVNHYEWSKYACEQLLLDDGLPLSVARLATVVAEDGTGTVGQYNAYHNTLKLFFYGLLSLMPGDPATPLALTTADFTGRGLAHLLRPEVPTGVYHLAPPPELTVTLGEVVETAFTTFEEDAAFRRRRMLRPRFCGIHSFRDMVEAARGLSGSPMALAMESVAPFAEQMFLSKRFETGRLHAVWPHAPAPDGRRLVEATCLQLIGTRWGRRHRPAQEETE
ncbi:MAG: SDR family oxidoreductase [Thermocrispum sp.]